MIDIYIFKCKRLKEKQEGRIEVYQRDTKLLCFVSALLSTFTKVNYNGYIPSVITKLNKQEVI